MKIKTKIVLSVVVSSLIITSIFADNADFGTGNEFYGVTDLNQLDNTSDNNVIGNSLSNILTNSDSNQIFYDSLSNILTNSDSNQIYSSLSNILTNSDSNQIYSSDVYKSFQNILNSSDSNIIIGSSWNELNNVSLTNIFFSNENMIRGVSNTLYNSNSNSLSDSFTNNELFGAYDSEFLYGEYNLITGYRNFLSGGSSYNDILGSSNYIEGRYGSIIGNSIKTYGNYISAFGSDITNANGSFGGIHTENILAVGARITYGVSGSGSSNVLAVGNDLVAQRGFIFGFNGTNSGYNSVLFTSNSVTSNSESDVFNIGDRRLTGLLDPTLSSDAISKGYADSRYILSTSLSSYYTKTEVDTLVSGAGGGSVDLTPYSTTVDMNTAIQNYSYSKAELDNNFYTRTQTESYVNSFTYSQSSLDSKFSDTLTNSNNFTTTKLLDYYTKNDTDLAFASKSNTYTKTEVDTLVSSAGGGSVDLSNFYTKAQIDTFLSTNSNSVDTVKTESIAYTDTVKTELKTDIDTVKTESIAYTDTAKTELKTDIDTAKTESIAYTDTVKTELKTDIDTAKTESIAYTDNQISSTKQELKDYTDQRFNDSKSYTDSKISEVRKEMDAKAALASALSQPLDFSGNKNAFNVSVGNFNGKSAIAASIGRKLHNDISYKISIGTSGKDNAGSLSIGYSW